MIRYPIIQSIDVWTENTVLMRKADIQNGIAQEVEVTIAGDVRAIVLGVTVRDVANENQKDKSIVMNILIFPRSRQAGKKRVETHQVSRTMRTVT